MTLLKLLALDEEDLQVVSSHLQDAVVRVGDMVFLPSQKRFVAIVNRFDWESATGKDTKNYKRRRTGLRFDRVLSAKHKELRPEKPDRVLSLLAIQFEAGEAPSGTVTLTFSGGVIIQLEVECVEAELRDLGPSWVTRNKPDHPGDAAADTESSGASGA
ncbi:MAG: DUF2948 family protein [Alphaproteobacteria bacterium]|jgi:hypothetical protein|uniref:DUF2948 family protein n=1 Tax=Methyloceanibacter sp. TaxID=1965321 RepID=UPI0035628C3B